jgi:Uma2 family endonuclease
MTAIRKRPISASEYWKLYDLRCFAHERVELIGGEIVTKSPQSNWHGIAIANVFDALRAIFDRQKYFVRNQCTLDLGPLSQPDPDVYVALGSKRSWAVQNVNPKSAVLIVEVSDSTLRDDRTRKASLYAASGIADYWILNLVDRQLEVRRDPRPDSTQDFGHGYASLATLYPGDSASPLVLPTESVAVADLLP